MFQGFGTIRWKVHFIVHRFFVSELYINIVPTSQILHNIFKGGVIKVEIAIFPVDIRIQVNFGKNEISIWL